MAGDQAPESGTVAQPGGTRGRQPGGAAKCGDGHLDTCLGPHSGLEAHTTELMKKRVLIVDDDATVRRSIGKVLEEAGYDVAQAGDGQEAVVQFAPEQIDLVLLDLNLPQESGWDVFERLTTWCPLVPIIVITGMANQYPTALAAGVGALLEKPLEAPALLEAMDQLLAEPKEARLRRMCGYQNDTAYVRSQMTRANRKPAGETMPAHTRFRPRYPVSQGED